MRFYKLKSTILPGKMANNAYFPNRRNEFQTKKKLLPSERERDLRYVCTKALQHIYYMCRLNYLLSVFHKNNRATEFVVVVVVFVIIQFCRRFRMGMCLCTFQIKISVLL